MTSIWGQKDVFLRGGSFGFICWCPLGQFDFRGDPVALGAKRSSEGWIRDEGYGKSKGVCGVKV